ncbi:MAG: hypothetical protein ABIP79_14575, partial [Chitinophagaceae bacterium]
RIKLESITPEEIQFEKDLHVIQEKDGRTDTLYNIGRDFTIMHLKLDLVLANLQSDHFVLAIQDDELSIDQDMMHLIDFIEAGSKLTPPIIYTIGDKLAIFDGKQQISLCRHLNIETMPFLVRHLGVDKVQSLLRM